MLYVLEWPPMEMVRSHIAGEGRGAYVRQAVVDEVLVYLVGEDEEIVSNGEISQPWSSSLEKTLPVGLAGVLIIIPLVLDVTSLSSSARSKAQSGGERVCVHGHGVHGKKRVDMVPVVRLEEDYLVPRIEERPCTPSIALRLPRRKR